MQISDRPFALAAILAVGAQAQSTPTEQEIIEALLPSSASGQGPSRTRSMSGERGVRVSGGSDL